MASIRDTLTKLLASDKPEPGTPLARAVGQYPFQQGEAPLEAPMLSPDDLIGTGIGKAALAGGAKLAPLLLGHTAFHGSPHVFDKFMLEKIGTGEGAQAYGHGMYFAESPKVAKSYTESTSKVSPRLRMAYDEAGGDWVKAEQIAQEKAKTDPTWKNIPLEAKALEKGNIYKVDIPDEFIPKMLEWNKPISEQSLEVQKAISPIVKSYGLPSNELGSSVYKATQEILGQERKLMSKRDELLDKYMTPNMGMSDAVRSMSIEDQAKFSDIANKIANLKNAPKMASEYLNKRGLAGIKYLDEGSRELGQGTNNFVVFDPSEVKILDKSKKLSDLLK